MSSETAQAPIIESQKSVEKEQEAKLRQKYPGLRGPGSSSFLQKRLSKGQRYFDSGDYNMAKAKGAMPPPSSIKVPTSATKTPSVATTTTSPTKPIVIDHQLEHTLMSDATGDTIPTPESLQQRKPSLVTSKLVTEATS